MFNENITQTNSTGTIDSVTGNNNAVAEVIYYTDPLCCWSWGFEPQWRKLLFEYGDHIQYRYVMGGLLPSWNNFIDSVNSVSRPFQMGPVWMHAQQLSGMPIQQTIWMRDPPASSYPACMAFKSVESQSRQGAEIYLRLLREAVMVYGQNIAKQEVLLQLATKLATIERFDVALFKKNMNSPAIREAFRKDLQEVQYHKINRFPSLVIKHQDKAVLIAGYRQYTLLEEAIRKVAGPIEKQPLLTVEAFKQSWPFYTKRELQEVSLGINDEQKESR
jgi:putative protein-disulfide isomerase